MSNSERQIGAVKIVEGNAKSSNKNDCANDPFECRISSFSSINYHNFLAPYQIPEMVLSNRCAFPEISRIIFVNC